MDEGLGGFLFGLFVGAVAAMVFGGILFISNINDIALRSLSCMANGNTIAQCETVLGVKVPK